jgi:hypothetical protein
LVHWGFIEAGKEFESDITDNHPAQEKLAFGF